MKLQNAKMPFALLFGVIALSLTACSGDLTSLSLASSSSSEESSSLIESSTETSASTSASSSSSSSPSHSTGTSSSSSGTSSSSSSSSNTSSSSTSPSSSSGGTSSSSSSEGASSSSSSASSSSSSSSNLGYWSGIDTSGSTFGANFRLSLYSIMVAKGTATGSNSYNQLNQILKKSDALPNGGVAAFYRKDTASGGWNKEHCWPNSRGAGENRGFAGTDPQVIRPTNSSDNSSRSNYMYNEVSDPTSAHYSASTGWDPAAFGYEGARGESARIILYAATRYYNKAKGAGGSYKGSAAGLTLTNNLTDSSTNATMGKLSVLLKWNMTYPVTRAEIYRNDYLGGISYARNPFIDHPDWANYIWDTNGIRSGSYTPNSARFSI
jgi:endonuclease I